MTSRNVTTIDDAGFEHEVLAAEQPVLVDFTARWCGPCKRLAPILDAVAEEQRGRCKVVSVDVDDAPRVAQRYRIRGMPTLVVFRGGEPIAQHVGLTTKAKVVALLDSADC